MYSLVPSQAGIETLETLQRFILSLKKLITKPAGVLYFLLRGGVNLGKYAFYSTYKGVIGQVFKCFKWYNSPREMENYGEVEEGLVIIIIYHTFSY